MSKLRIAASSFAVLALLAGAIVAAGKVTSGPQAGEELAGPFHPLNITGDMAGQKQCLYCKNGSNPVVMIFAREVSKPLASLVKKIDAATVDNSKAKMGSFVVFLGDEDEDFVLAGVEAYNNFLFEEFCAPDPKRLIGMAQIPSIGIDSALA